MTLLLNSAIRSKPITTPRGVRATAHSLYNTRSSCTLTENIPKSIFKKKTSAAQGLAVKRREGKRSWVGKTAEETRLG